MQRDFLEPGGFGEMLGNDVSQLRGTIEPNKRLLATWRARGWHVIHTREGHRPDLGCLPHAKKVRGRSPTTIGDKGPMGRILVRGESGHDIIPELYPQFGEAVIDKPGKGAFYATDLKLDFGDERSAVVASEFVGTSISAAGDDHDVRVRDLALNPHVRHYDGRWRGYLRCEIDHARWRTDLRAIDDVADASSGVRTLQTCHVESGRAGIV
jgi:hypothetical protein